MLTLLTGFKTETEERPRHRCSVATFHLLATWQTAAKHAFKQEWQLRGRQAMGKGKASAEDNTVPQANRNGAARIPLMLERNSYP